MQERREAMMTKKQDARLEEARQAWEAPTVKTVGTVGQVLQGGGGKLSIEADDTGDAPRKPRGLDN